MERSLFGFILRYSKREQFMIVPLGGRTFADALKMIMKETIIPSGANRFLFILAPMLTFGLAVLAFVLIDAQEP